MLNAAGLAFVVAGARWGQADGQVMFIFVLAMAAAEVAVGLALALLLPPVAEQPGRGRRRRDERLRCCRCSGSSPRCPLAGFLLLALLGRRLAARAAAWIGAGSVGLACLVALAVGGSFIVLSAGRRRRTTRSCGTGSTSAASPPASASTWTRCRVILMLVVTVVGFLIHLYSTEFMADDEGYSRFFAYMNLFVGSMLILVLADNLLLLYLGWEGVGLCSYLLIGFWYKDPAQRLAARKAFIVTRIGDTALIVGLFLLFTQLRHAADPADAAPRAQRTWPCRARRLAVAAALLLLGGAVGKSAQLPLQTWLPDAMAGPSPVSALIHAATMVTAGVYLIARTNVLFALAPSMRGSSWRSSAR